MRGDPDYDAYMAERGDAIAEERQRADEDRAAFEAERAEGYLETLYTDDDRRMDWIDESAAAETDIGMELERAATIP